MSYVRHVRSKSRRANRLRSADPEWLGRLRTGVTLILACIFAGYLVALVSVTVLPANSRPQVAGLLALAIGLWQIYGIILLTVKEPKAAPHEDPGTLRTVIRMCAVAVLLGQVVALLYQNHPQSPILVVLSFIVSVAALVLGFGLFIFLRHLARRIPDPRLARATTFLIWGMVVAIAILLLALVYILARLALPDRGTAWDGSPLAIVWVGVAAVLALSIWYLILLMRYRRAFAAAAEFAWEHATPHTGDAIESRDAP